ncbi:MAG: NAD-dependent protein deacetylase [Burkholderiales bacterium]|nr:NAD-dependent protein deacetylase [Burkholderiales bacterium]
MHATARAHPAVADAIAPLADLMRAAPCVLAISGAGVSTDSGIPAYRDRAGQWARRAPVTHQEFVASAAVRRRYWARSMLGWPMLRAARPNDAHRALARLERGGRIGALVTQNVDGLHGAAGSTAVIELHGRLREVRCLDCGTLHARDAVQAAMRHANPAFAACAAAAAPDGDADLEADFDRFVAPACAACGGTLKPDVVFYGDAVPRARALAADRALAAADALLVVGSTMMVRSAYRLCEAAHAAGKPVAAINLGRTRADPLYRVKIEAECGVALPALAAVLGA